MNRIESLCHSCGLHTDVCLFVECLCSIARNVTTGNFQVHLAQYTVQKFLNVQ